MKKILKKCERGYTTVETCISLLIFMVAVLFIYSQIKSVIAESIIQNALNNMAKEVSGYIYVADKMGLIIDYQDTDDTNKVWGDVKDIDSKFDATITSLFNGEDASSSSSDFIDAMRKFAGDLKGALSTGDGKLNTQHIAEEAKNAGIDIAMTGVKGALSKVLANYLESRIDAYLPMEREQFCKYFGIDDQKFSFEGSRIFPTTANNTILLAVTYESTAPFSNDLFHVKRKVVKTAYTSAWVYSNTNDVKAMLSKRGS